MAAFLTDSLSNTYSVKQEDTRWVHKTHASFCQDFDRRCVEVRGSGGWGWPINTYSLREGVGSLVVPGRHNKKQTLRDVKHGLGAKVKCF